eukprot:COSAG02_NODE_158_length_32954_cov_16.416771_9_plen_184_part_00
MILTSARSPTKFPQQPTYRCSAGKLHTSRAPGHRPSFPVGLAGALLGPAASENRPETSSSRRRRLARRRGRARARNESKCPAGCRPIGNCNEPYSILHTLNRVRYRRTRSAKTCSQFLATPARRRQAVSQALAAREGGDGSAPSLRPAPTCVLCLARRAALRTAGSQRRGASAGVWHVQWGAR